MFWNCAVKKIVLPSLFFQAFHSKLSAGREVNIWQAIRMMTLCVCVANDGALVFAGWHS